MLVKGGCQERCQGEDLLQVLSTRRFTWSSIVEDLFVWHAKLPIDLKGLVGIQFRVRESS